MTAFKAPPSVTADHYLVVHEAHRRHLPPLRPYVRELLRRRTFAMHMARADLKAKHYDTVLGQLWRVLNPLLLALIYYLVLGVILGTNKGDPNFLPRLLAGLFAYYYTINALNFGARSVIGGGQLIMNLAFPRALLPLSAAVSAFLTYIPMLLVYAVFHVLGGEPIGWQLLFVPVIVLIHTMFNLGLAFLLAAATVYFRDTSSFLPYLLRVWLYLSPVLWSIEDVPDRFRSFLVLNPLVPLFSVWHDVLIGGTLPAPAMLLGASAWAVLVLVIGTWFFLTREGEFAVRL
jgi:ABC-type polysaccharide/polyol phosphate export permease